MQRLLRNQGRCSLSSVVMKEWLEKNDSNYIIAESKNDIVLQTKRCAAMKEELFIIVRLFHYRNSQFGMDR
jgi:hypothetical protein